MSKRNVISKLGRKIASSIGISVRRPSLAATQEPQPTPISGPVVEADGTPIKGVNFDDRFRDVISDPINTLIDKHPSAGTIQGNWVTMHNGLKTGSWGAGFGYYGVFAKLLIYNRGIHEPLEEFCFQQLLEVLSGSTDGVMLELGAYWGHYSMWMKDRFPSFHTILVEPEENHLECGRRNFIENGMEGEFIKACVGKSAFRVDAFCKERGIPSITLLHSDIQGFEVEMLEDATEMLSAKAIDYIFVSTHSTDIHRTVEKHLRDVDYRIEINSCPDTHSTSFDGLFVASSPNVSPVFRVPLTPMGRKDICHAAPEEVLSYLTRIRESLK